MAPLEKRVLPPRSACGAFSITMTDAPASRAAIAALSPAMPAPTTSTSVSSAARSAGAADMAVSLLARLAQDLVGVAEIPFQDLAIDGGELHQVRDRRVLVDLVHGASDQAELDHRAVVLDEACVRRAARCGERRCAPGDLPDRADREIDERPGRRQERVGVRRLPFDVPADVATRDVLGADLDQRAQ